MSGATQKAQLSEFFLKPVYFVKRFHPQTKIVKFAPPNRHHLGRAIYIHPFTSRQGTYQAKSVHGTWVADCILLDPREYIAMPATISSSLCTVAALSGRRASQQGGNKQRAVAQPLAAGVVTEAAPPLVSAPRRRGGADELVAWKSIRQERWEGALEVEGKLPTWLVGELLCLHKSIYLCMFFVLFSLPS